MHKTRRRCTSENACLPTDYINTHCYRRHMTAKWVQDIPDDALPVEDVEDFDARFENEYQGKREPPPFLIEAIEKEKAKALAAKKKAELKKSKQIPTSTKSKTIAISKNKNVDHRILGQTRKINNSTATQDTIYKTADEYSISKKNLLGKNNTLIFNGIESPLQMHISKFAELYKDRLLDEQPTCSKYANIYQESLTNPTHAHIYKELLKRGPLCKKTREYMKALDERSPGVRYTVPYKKRFRNYDLFKEKTPHNSSSSTGMSTILPLTTRNKKNTTRRNDISLMNKIENINKKGRLQPIYKLDLSEPTMQPLKVNFRLNNNSLPIAGTKSIANRNFLSQTAELRSSKSHADLTAEKNKSLRSSSRIERALKKGAVLKNPYNVNFGHIRPSKYFIELRNKFEPIKQKVKSSDNNLRGGKNVTLTKKSTSAIIMSIPVTTTDKSKSQRKLQHTSKVPYPTKVLNKQMVPKCSVAMEKVEPSAITNSPIGKTIFPDTISLRTTENVSLREVVPSTENSNIDKILIKETVKLQSVHTSQSAQKKLSLHKLTHVKEISIENNVSPPNIKQKRPSSTNNTAVQQRLSNELINSSDNNILCKEKVLTKNTIVNQCNIKHDKLPYINLRYAKKTFVRNTHPTLEKVLAGKSTNHRVTSARETSIANRGPISIKLKKHTAAETNIATVKETSGKNKIPAYSIEKKKNFTDVNTKHVNESTIDDTKLEDSNIQKDQVLDPGARSVKETAVKTTTLTLGNTKNTPAKKNLTKDTVPHTKYARTNLYPKMKAAPAKESTVKNTVPTPNSMKKDQFINMKTAPVKNIVPNLNKRKDQSLNVKSTTMKGPSVKNVLPNPVHIRSNQCSNNKATSVQETLVKNSISSPSNIKRIQYSNTNTIPTKENLTTNTFPSFVVKKINNTATAAKENSVKRIIPNNAKVIKAQPTGKIIADKEILIKNIDIHSNKLKTNLNAVLNTPPAAQASTKNAVPTSSIVNKHQSSNEKATSSNNVPIKNNTTKKLVPVKKLQELQVKTTKDTSSKSTGRNQIMVKKVQFPKTIPTAINTIKTASYRPILRNNQPSNIGPTQTKKVLLKSEGPNSTTQNKSSDNNTTFKRKALTNNSVNDPLTANANEPKKFTTSSKGRNPPSKEVLKFVSSRLSEQKKRTQAASVPKTLALPENNISTV